MDKFTIYPENKYNNYTTNELPLNEDLEDKAIDECSKLLKGETFVCNGVECVVLSDAERCYKEGYKAGANWQKELLSDKACKWFYEQLFEGTMECKNIEALITDFKIKMEE